LTGFIWFYRIF